MSNYFIHVADSKGKISLREITFDDSLVIEQKGAKKCTIRTRNGALRICEPVRCRYTDKLPEYVVSGEILTGVKTGNLVADGIVLEIGDRVLIDDDATIDPVDNGIYVLTVKGSVSSKWVLTRAEDFNESNEVTNGSTVSVLEGRSCADTTYTLRANYPFKMGQHSVHFDRFQSFGIKKIESVGAGVPVFKGISGTSAQFASFTVSNKMKLQATQNVLNFDVIESELDITKMKGHVSVPLFDDNGLFKQDNARIWSIERVRRELTHYANKKHEHTAAEITGLTEYIGELIENRISEGIHADCIVDNVLGFTVAEREKLAKLQVKVPEITAERVRELYEANNNVARYTPYDRELLYGLATRPAQEIVVREVPMLDENEVKYTIEERQKLVELETMINKTKITAGEIAQLYESNAGVLRFTSEYIKRLAAIENKTSMFSSIRFAQVNSTNCDSDEIITCTSLAKGKPHGTAGLDASGKLSTSVLPAISHRSLSDLDTDSHMIYAKLDGRAGGQTLCGGTNAGDLVLASNQNGNGSVSVRGDLVATNIEARKIKTENVSVGNLMISGELEYSGKINGIDLHELKARGDALNSRLVNLSGREIEQLENINDTQITSDNWARVSSLNQNLASNSNVAFQHVDAVVSRARQPMIDHASLSNLDADSHAIYAKLDGRENGQMLCGSINSGGTLVLAGSQISDGTIVMKDPVAFESRCSFNKGLVLPKTVLTTAHGTATRTGLRVPENISYYEVIGTAAEPFDLLGPTARETGLLLHIYNATHVATTGELPVPANSGAVFVFNGNVFRKMH